MDLEKNNLFENERKYILTNKGVYVDSLYGISTWGDDYHQESIEIEEDGSVFLSVWYNGGYDDDTVEENYLGKIVKESSEPFECKYVKKFLEENLNFKEMKFECSYTLEELGL